MYSPLDYSQAIFSPNGYSQLHQFRGTNNGESSVVCEYEVNYPLFAADWGAEDYVCLGSYMEGSKNRLQVIKSLDLLTWDKVAECNVTFPVSNIQWQPGRTRQKKFATCSDSLRIWDINEDENIIQEQINLSVCKYNKQQNSHTAVTATHTNANTVDSQRSISGSLLGELPPITSFHWNPIDTNLLISSSIDTTCIVWDLQTSNYVKTQLIAHDSEVFDVRFLTQSTQLFASCGGDGSVRVFDLRCLAHSTIIYEPNVPTGATQLNTNADAATSATMGEPAPHPSVGSDLDTSSQALLRLEPSPFDPNVIATFALDSNSILILDMRNPGSPVFTLEGHNASVNQIKWHPTRRNVILSCGDDCQVLYWDINKWLDGTTVNNSPNTALGSPSKSPFTTSNSSSVNGMPNDTSETEVSKWNSKNHAQTLDTPSMFYANKGQEVNNIVWRPQGGEWFGAISAKQFQNVRI